jgi:hypothetical protein
MKPQNLSECRQFRNKDLKKFIRIERVQKFSLIIVCYEYNEIKDIGETKFGITTIFSTSLEAP